MIDIYGKKINLYIAYFMIYSFLGWFIETLYVSLQKNVLTFRGFLYGPICPVYGFGALAVLLFTRKIHFVNIGSEMLLKFIISSSITTVLEYLTALTMETLTREKLWDYSVEFLNLNGRICLKISIAWGFISLFISYILQPLLNNLLIHINKKTLSLITNISLIFITFDALASISSTTNINIIHNLISFFTLIV